MSGTRFQRLIQASWASLMRNDMLRMICQDASTVLFCVSDAICEKGTPWLWEICC